MVNKERLQEAIEKSLNSIAPQKATYSKEEDDRWAKSGYEPTPTIIEAAVALYEEHTVEDITKHGGDIDKASEEIIQIINYCRDNCRKAI